MTEDFFSGKFNEFFVGLFDITELTLYAFFLFFAGLVIYLRREDRREGYPLEDEATGRLEPTPGFLFYAKPKTFILPHGRGTHSVPNGSRDNRDLAAAPAARWDGAPLEPLGDPMLAAVGPGSYAQRADRPDLMMHGDLRIVPLRKAEGFFLPAGEPNPIGFAVIGADKATGGIVKDLWVDRTEYMIRYIEIALVDANGQPTDKTVLAPMTMAIIQKGKKRVLIQAVLGAQIANAPVLANPEQITLLEEEKIVAYFGAGYLYATPRRAEPIL